MTSKQKRDKDRYKTKEGLANRMYWSQCGTSKTRADNPPTYSKKEFKEWLFSQTLFHILFDNWKRLDYQKEYVPSVDRKDDYIGYTMDNIQLMTWAENNQKFKEDMKKGKNTKKCKAIRQYKDGVFIEEFISLSEASETTGVNAGNISEICNGAKGHKTAGGFFWEWAKDE